MPQQPSAHPPRERQKRAGYMPDPTANSGQQRTRADHAENAGAQVKAGHGNDHERYNF
jgi:hypothetical protein